MIELRAAFFLPLGRMLCYNSKNCPRKRNQKTRQHYFAQLPLVHLKSLSLSSLYLHLIAFPCKSRSSFYKLVLYLQQGLNLPFESWHRSARYLRSCQVFSLNLKKEFPQKTFTAICMSFAYRSNFLSCIDPF